MNEIVDLLYRLLKLFPVKFIKEHYNVALNSQNEIIHYIINHNPEVAIKNFALNNFDYTKQHIYLYTLNKSFNRNEFDFENFPLQIINETDLANHYEFSCLPIVDFEAIALNPFEQITINYFQPTLIIIDDKHLIIKCTILEKNVNYLFGINRRVVDMIKNNDEESFINKIKDYLSTDNYTIVETDINKGVKYLWENDFIDSKFVKWKKARSSAQEAMDEGFTLKGEYPDIYQNLMTAPLNKTIFKYTGNEDSKFCSHFTVDSTKGQLSIPLYPENNQQIKNIIDEILLHN